MSGLRKYLLCIVGVGAGNTTRALAILRELQRLGPCEIRLAAQGRAWELLEPHFQTYKLETVSYTGGSGGGEFGAASIVRHNLGFPARFRANVRRHEEILAEYEPDLVIADSDFYCLSPARRLGFRLVAINNSPWTVEVIRRLGGVPPECRFSYHVIEKTDAWLQRRYPQDVLCPVLRPLREGLEEKVHQLPPFVRPDIVPLREPGDEVVVVTGGSGIDSAAMDLRELRDVPVRVLGTRLERVPAQAEQMGFTLDVGPYLKRARVLVVQGGFSSVSEALALRVPTVVLPIRNHAEQWCNGRLLERLGAGLMSRDPGQAGAAVRRILGDYERFWEAAQGNAIPLDGHVRAARWLERLAGGGGGEFKDES